MSIPIRGKLIFVFNPEKPPIFIIGTIHQFPFPVHYYSPTLSNICNYNLRPFNFPLPELIPNIDRNLKFHRFETRDFRARAVPLTNRP